MVCWLIEVLGKEIKGELVFAPLRPRLSLHRDIHCMESSGVWFEPIPILIVQVMGQCITSSDSPNAGILRLKSTRSELQLFYYTILLSSFSRILRFRVATEWLCPRTSSPQKGTEPELYEPCTCMSKTSRLLWHRMLKPIWNFSTVEAFQFIGHKRLMQWRQDCRSIVRIFSHLIDNTLCLCSISQCRRPIFHTCLTAFQWTVQTLRNTDHNIEPHQTTWTCASREQITRRIYTVYRVFKPVSTRG